MRFVETVTRKFFQQIKDFIGFSCRDFIEFGTAFDKKLPVLLHDLHFLLSHGPAEQIRPSEGVSCENLGCLHDLFLVDHDAVCLLTDGFEEGVRILDGHFSMSTANEVGNQIHRPRSVKGDQCCNMLYRGNLKLAAEIPHATGFQLEDAHGVSLVQEIVGRGIIQRESIHVQLDAFGSMDHVATITNHREGLQTQEIHFEQSEIAHRIHGILGDGTSIFILLEGKDVVERFGPDHHPGGVHRAVPGDIFQDEGGIDQFSGDLF